MALAQATGGELSFAEISTKFQPFHVPARHITWGQHRPPRHAENDERRTRQYVWRVFTVAALPARAPATIIHHTLHPARPPVAAAAHPARHTK